MKNLLLTLILIFSLISALFAQDGVSSYSKDDFIGTWRFCNALSFEENTDTIFFQKATPDCRENDCGEHQWSFRKEGSIEFVFTKGCDTGFNSVSRNPKRWFYIEKDRILKFVSNDGFKDVYFVQEMTDKTLTLVRRRDLE